MLNLRKLFGAHRFFMANFNTHLTGGFIVSALVAVTTYKAGIIDDDMLLICTMVGTIGGLLPDIDSDNSTPVKVGFNLLAIISAFLVVMVWGRQRSLIEILLIWLTSFGVMRYGILLGYSRLTIHRGVVHSLPYMAMFSLLTVHLCFTGLAMNALNSWLIGVFVFIGSMVHLVLDELYSVNLLNMKIKRSFGTALKVFEIKKWYFYLCVYISLVPLLLFSPSFKPLWNKVSDSMTWLILSRSLLP